MKLSKKVIIRSYGNEDNNFVNILEIESKGKGLEINIGKTEVMVISKKNMKTPHAK